MNVNITSIDVYMREGQPDQIELFTELPSTMPNIHSDKAVLTIRTTKGYGMSWVIENFFNVDVGAIYPDRTCWNLKLGSKEDIEKTKAAWNKLK